MSDADQDGAHITGLMCAMIRKYWPELFSLGMVYKFITPLVKVMIGNKTTFFYSLSEFNTWVESNRNVKYTTRYLKGLGSSTAKDFRDYFDKMDKHLIQLQVDSVEDLAIVDLVFGKDHGSADKRKVWLDLEEKMV